MSETLTDICRIDPTFDTVQFLRLVQYDIIPNIFEVNNQQTNSFVSSSLLQSLARGELEILRDWCTEAVSGRNDLCAGFLHFLRRSTTF